MLLSFYAMETEQLVAVATRLLRDGTIRSINQRNAKTEILES
jgi:hypothetical protein